MLQCTHNCGLFKPLVVFYLLLSMTSVFTKTRSITTATLIRATAQAIPHCLHYRIKGTCYWWVKDGFTGHPAVPAKVAHYIPDVVVSVFDRAGDNP